MLIPNEITNIMDNQESITHQDKIHELVSVYIILCTDNTFYTGITIDVTRRFDQHSCGGEQNIFAAANLNSWFT